MNRARPDRQIVNELDALRARLALAQQEELQRRQQLEQLRKDFARLGQQLRDQREKS